GVSVAASVVSISAAGCQLAVKLCNLISQIITAPDRIIAISNDVSLPCSILQQLVDLMTQEGNDGAASIFNESSLETTETSAVICQGIFTQLEQAVKDASKQIREAGRPIGKIKLSAAEKAKWPFLHPSMDIFRNDLKEAKGILMLMLQITMEHRDIVRSTLELLKQANVRSKLRSSTISRTAFNEATPKPPSFQNRSSDPQLFSDFTTTACSGEKECKINVASGKERCNSTRRLSFDSIDDGLGTENELSQYFITRPVVEVLVDIVQLRWNLPEDTDTAGRNTDKCRPTSTEGHPTIAEILQGLHIYERKAIDDAMAELGMGASLTLLGKRTEDLCSEGIFLKGVPSLQFVLKPKSPLISAHLLPNRAENSYWPGPASVREFLDSRSAVSHALEAQIKEGKTTKRILECDNACIDLIGELSELSPAIDKPVHDLEPPSSKINTTHLRENSAFKSPQDQQPDRSRPTSPGLTMYTARSGPFLWIRANFLRLGTKAVSSQVLERPAPWNRSRRRRRRESSTVKPLYRWTPDRHEASAPAWSPPQTSRLPSEDIKISRHGDYQREKMTIKPKKKTSRTDSVNSLGDDASLSSYTSDAVLDHFPPAQTTGESSTLSKFREWPTTTPAAGDTFPDTRSEPESDQLSNRAESNGVDQEGDEMDEGRHPVDEEEHEINEAEAERIIQERLRKYTTLTSYSENQTLLIHTSTPRRLPASHLIQSLMAIPHLIPKPKPGFPCPRSSSGHRPNPNPTHTTAHQSILLINNLLNLPEINPTKAPKSPHGPTRQHQTLVNVVPSLKSTRKG
ncbi:MAG: hypothetical protein Q9170_007534, partial [Blastenia crenularia]